MGARSTLEFRSNIYPVKAKGRLTNDVDFVAAISDPKALVELEKVSRRPPLSELQEWQLKKGKPCLIGDGRYTPWGTKVINGRREVVCLCEEAGCVLFEKCMERHPSVVEVSGETKTSRLALPVTKGVDAQYEDARSVDSSQRLRLGVERRDVMKIASTEATESSWTPEDDARLKDYFGRYPREILYGFFPEKEIADIESRIWKVCFSFAPKSTAPANKRRQTQLPTNERIVSEKKYGTSSHTLRSKRRDTSDFSSRSGRNAAIKQANREHEEKRRRRKELHRRPWETDEDVILMRNYPLYGSNMFLWDEKLFGRKKDAIEKRARQLDVKHNDASPNVSRILPK